MYNSGTKNSINTVSTGQLILHEFAGGNHNIVSVSGFIGNKPAVVGVMPSYDKVDIIAEATTGAQVITQLGAVMRHGASNVRPSYGAGNYGTYYDSQLKKPIWWDGAKWVDASGVSV